MSFSTLSYNVVILAGGASKRFGEDKCDHEIDCKTFLQRISENFDEPIIVTKRIRRIKNGIQVLDNVNGGPVEAIKLALPYLSKEKVFITGCDYPFLSKRIADEICSKDAEISIVDTGELQPLIGCYSLKFLRDNIDKVKKMLDFVQLAKRIYIVGTHEIRLKGIPLKSFVNVNNWDDLTNSYKPKFTLSKYIIKC
ncbi:molybdenum cofactor guanylyltransferase [Sulfolobus acidocaldarius]|uniref:Conserved protein n=4 Tax=Sulfolobus acidocaldarius TaxID=2285 RepID=Q4JCE9_SULAC|nr:molybdenum cofactor guanylyltransferase [Sulfolobus acidocaldarius]AAY79530.1 conserved protein [Sulfolobus acidocaldarius DSM 639]AGE70080.1 hypothetical protein SacN8_00495 [Sulfolobus acidocaldarius N8]AGE72355.1 hypothetical protein SacRon12I_00495 [Sulfolobus acidocaldarius Ron12/I]ALU29498.1 molybdopterin-guanine dinucleotide biosynthesis protein A [Sulfolobus acidocaldarius]ALU32228.1 molybdopterin-guanine dinucleotide biosynthesis protein A [Sulfolobus acidocaldarius]